jgi:hypothetical protein
MQYLTRIHPTGYLERLGSLIEERLKPGADKKAIDARIWDIFGETWSVLFTDLSGFSRHVAEFGITPADQRLGADHLAVDVIIAFLARRENELSLTKSALADKI